MDKQAQEQQSWSRSVSHELITVVLQGDWEVHIIPRPLAKAWLGEIVGKNILCLASAGGQQAPVLAAAGANVTVFDLSDQQLQQDRMVAEREGLHLKTVQGNMCDLHAFHNAEFDLIIQPISNL